MSIRKSEKQVISSDSELDGMAYHNRVEAESQLAGMEVQVNKINGAFADCLRDVDDYVNTIGQLASRSSCSKRQKR